ncbi:holo-ACP synthase [Gammaproteobacteria bacterium]|nr:holo-ACP synthase [Gammaproteobacteria bacterium]
MIYGIGTDIVLINRIKNTEAFAKKILSSDELLIWQDYSSAKQQSFLAKQFACKEATAKALGTGFRDNLYPRDIEILRNDLGKPYINPQGSLKNIFSDLKILGSHVSIADETDYVVAFAIIEK